MLKCHLHNSSVSKPFELAPLMWVLDIKKEGKPRDARISVGGHVVDAYSSPACSSVAQNLSICLLLLISKANNCHVATSDVGNSCLNANIGESVHARAGE